MRAVAPDRLARLLEPHRQFFAGRGLVLPPPGSGEAPDCSELLPVFMSPDEKTPKELIDALYVVDEMATPEGMDALLGGAGRRGLVLDPCGEYTPADVAVQVWLLDRDLLERKHAEQFLDRPRTFVSYRATRSTARPFQRPSDAQLRGLEQSLDDWFEGHKRGRATRVFAFDRPDGVWFLVRHGEPFKREESLRGEEASSVCYRPARHDVLAYHPEVGELRINARTQGEKALYQRAFGQALFGDEGHFPGAEKYTLEPLREAGEAALNCADIEGIDWVKLREVQTYHAGAPWEIVTRRSDDFFALLKARNRPFPIATRIVQATFAVKFTTCKTPRSVVVKPSNVARFTRDEDSVCVEAWLKARGFIRGREGEDGEPVGEVLAST